MDEVCLLHYKRDPINHSGNVLSCSCDPDWQLRRAQRNRTDPPDCVHARFLHEQLQSPDYNRVVADHKDNFEVLDGMRTDAGEYVDWLHDKYLTPLDGAEGTRQTVYSVKSIRALNMTWGTFGCQPNSHSSTASALVWLSGEPMPVIVRMPRQSDLCREEDEVCNMAAVIII